MNTNSNLNNRPENSHNLAETEAAAALAVKPESGLAESEIQTRRAEFVEIEKAIRARVEKSA
ncbi:MAG: hypothetical protein NT167_01710 [Verrucomicrobia bacterium]|nr:hypothetical protein [Verrucomicrobiota bacterium]